MNKTSWNIFKCIYILGKRVGLVYWPTFRYVIIFDIEECINIEIVINGERSVNG